MKKTVTRALSWLLSVVMLLSLIPGTALFASAIERKNWDELTVGAVLGADSRVRNSTDKFVTLAAGRYSDWMGQVGDQDLTFTTDYDLSVERDGSIYTDFDEVFPVSQTGEFCTDWIILEKTDDSIKLAGYVEPQEDDAFTTKVIYRQYDDENGAPLPNGVLDAGTGIQVQSGTKLWQNGNFYVVSGTVTIDKRVTVNGTANLILLDGATLNANQGISVNADNTLNVYVGSTGSEIAGSGTLNSNASNSSGENAGIGGNSRTTGGCVNIHGGVITAKGKQAASGIGGGNNAGHQTLKFFDGTVTATGGDYGAAGIGGGFGANGGTVYIYGGSITAIGTGGSVQSAGIGGGGSTARGGAGGSVYIYGGTVTATGANGAMGIGGANGNDNHGSLTVGRGVTVYTSADNTDWTDTTADLSARARYMRTEYTLPLQSEHTHDGITFEPWNSTDSLPTSGSWYLSADVTVSTATVISNGTLNLCLSGHSITMNDNPQNGAGSVFAVSENATMNLYDESGNNGVITGGSGNSNGHQGGAFVVRGTFNLYGGTITGNSATRDGQISAGGGVFVSAGTFNMYGGVITNNVSANGGGVNLYEHATASVYDGLISGNSAYFGGGIIVCDSTLNLIGGKIAGNTCDADLYPDPSVNRGLVAGGADLFSYGSSTVNLSGTEIAGQISVTHPITITGALANRVYQVSLIDGSNSYNPKAGVITSGLPEKGNLSNFESGSGSDWITSLTADGEVLIGKKLASVTDGGVTTVYTDLPSALNAWVENSTLTLLADVTTNSAVPVNGTKTLDLNGYGIRQTADVSVFQINGGAVLTINDSNDTREHYITLNGSSRGTAVSDTGTESASCVKINGGYITGGNPQDSNGGGGLLLISNARVTMNGGNIVGNCTGSRGQGGGVCALGSSRFTMCGGYIRNNYCPGTGGGFQGNNGSGKSIFYGGTILNNRAGNGGGLNGCYIELYGPAPTRLQGASALIIKGNTASNDGGAVRGNIRLSGQVIFEGNTSPKGADMYMPADGDRINVTGPVAVNAPLKIAYSNGTGTVTTGYKSNMDEVDPTTVFVSSNPNYSVTRNAAGEVQLARLYTVTWLNDDESVLAATRTKADEMPIYTGPAPSKAQVDNAVYTFTGWTPELVPVTGDATYTATYISSDYVLYYTLNSAEDENGNRYMDYKKGETVEAKVWLKSGSDIELQAFDIFLKNDARLTRTGFTSANANLVTSGIGQSGETLTRFIAIGEDPAQPIKIAMTAGEPVLLGTITFTFSDNIPYGTQLPLTLMPVSNIAVQNTPESFTPAIGGYELGAEMMQTYTVTYNDNVADEEIAVPQDQTKQHGIDLTLAASSPVREGYRFVGWSTNPDAEEAEYAPSGKFDLDADTTLYAVWTQKVYHVRWYNGADLIEEDTVPYGALPSYDGATPTKAPTVLKVYTFVGWNTDPDAANPLPTLPNVKDDATYYAIFAESDRLYTVTWKSWDGSVIYGTSAHTYGTIPAYPAELPEPYQAETAEYTYTFLGWSKEANQETASGLENVIGDATYYAAFSKTPKTYDLILQGNGGTPETTIQSITYGDSAYRLPTDLVTRPGYTFTSWNDRADGTGTTYTEVGNLTANLTLYAQWTPIVYTLHYEANGGSGTVPDTTFTYEDVVNILGKDAFSKPGADFKMTGWNVKADGTGTSILADSTQTGRYLAELGADENYVVTLYAQWTDKQYTIEYDLAGGVVDGYNPNGYTHSDTLEVAIPNVPTRTGYTFGGWSVVSDDPNVGSVTLTNHDGSYWIPAGTCGNLMFTANWIANDYTITFVVDGETKATEHYTTATTQTLNDLFAAPTKDGYAFRGWKVTDAQGSWELDAIKEADFLLTGSYGDATLEALWESETYTLTFRDGETELKQALYHIDMPASLQMLYGSTPTKPGYTFAGWKYVDASVGNWERNRVYEQNETVTGKFGSVTLYAQWTPAPYTITFKHSTETLGTAAYTVTTDRTLGELSNFEIPERTGYRFLGWYLESTTESWTEHDYTNDFNVLGKYGDVVLVTKWEPIEYTVTFYNEDGTEIIGTEHFTVETDSIDEPALDDLQKPGYTVEWDEYDLNLPEDQDVYPVYTPIEYTITFDVDGGTPIDPMTYTIESTDTLPEAFKGLYAFKGWAVTEVETDGNWALGALYNAGTEVTGHFGNVTLKAIWSFEDNIRYEIEEYKYAYTGYVMLRIADTLNADQVYTYDGETMYYTTDENYLVSESDSGVFYALIPAAGNVEVFKLTEEGAAKVAITEAERQTVDYNGKINSDDVVNIADANAVFQMLAQPTIGGYYSLDQLANLKRLVADMVTDLSNADHRGSIQDVHEIVNIVCDLTAD